MTRPVTSIILQIQMRIRIKLEIKWIRPCDTVNSSAKFNRNPFNSTGTMNTWMCHCSTGRELRRTKFGSLKIFWCVQSPIKLSVWINILCLPLMMELRNWRNPRFFPLPQKVGSFTQFLSPVHQPLGNPLSGRLKFVGIRYARFRKIKESHNFQIR